MKYFLLFLLTLSILLPACELEDPNEGIPIEDIIVLTADQSELLANGKDRVLLTAELGKLADANQSITFRSDAGSFPAADPPGSTEFTVASSNKSATVVLQSSLEADEDVEVTAEVGDFKTILFLQFSPAYPDDMLLSADKSLIQSDRIDFANLTVELFRNEGAPSTGTRIDFEVIELDTAKAVIKDFAFTNDMSTLSVQVKSANGKPGQVQVFAHTRNQAGDPVSKSVDLVFE